MPENDPARLADQREEEADKLERRSQELGGEVQNVGQDWERKRADPGVPGAPPDESKDSGEGDEDRDSGEDEG